MPTPAHNGWTVVCSKKFNKKMRPKGGIAKSARAAIRDMIAAIEERGPEGVEMEPYTNESEEWRKIRVFDEVQKEMYRVPCLVDEETQTVELDDIYHRNQMPGKLSRGKSGRRRRR